MTETTPTTGELPAATWSSADHTGANVPIFVFGGLLPTAVIDNTEVFTLLGG